MDELVVMSDDTIWDRREADERQFQAEDQLEAFIKPAVEKALEGVNALSVVRRARLLRTLTEWTRDTATKLGINPDHACEQVGLNDV